MNFFHFNLKVASRGKNHSLAAKSAYISGEKLRDKYKNKTYNYSYRDDVKYKEILLPLEAPREFLDRQTFLDALNVAEKRKDAQMARVIVIALPNEFSLDENIALTKEFVNENFINLGYCADIAIHIGELHKRRKPESIEAVKERKDNPHAHIIIPFRMADKDGFQKDKKQSRLFYKRISLKKWREEWARLINRELEKRGIEDRVSHLSHSARCIELEPTIYLGSKIMALEAKGILTVRGDEHRRIMKRNRIRKMVRDKQQERERSFERNRSLDRSR